MSIVQVAKIAGVSHTTVSRYVNESAKVNNETAEKIRKAMETIGYVPKPPHQRRGPSSQALRHFKTRNLAFLTVSETSRILSVSPFLVDLLHGIEQSASGNGISVFQWVLSPDRPLPPFIARGEIDGLIVYPSLEGIPEEIINVLGRYPVVFVLSGHDSHFLGDRVMCNHERIGKCAADYLIRRGHQSVAYLDLASSPNYRLDLFGGRWRSFKELCDRAGVRARRLEIPLTPEATLAGGPEVACILHELVQQDLLTPWEGVYHTGIYVVFDSLTAVLYPVLHSSGIQIGRDLDIISCNNEEPLLAGLCPRPATIDLQSEKIGRLAFERLCYRIQNPADRLRVTLEVQPHLIEGGICV